MAINYYEQKLDMVECSMDHNMMSLVVSIMFHVGSHIGFWICDVLWGIEHIVLTALTATLTCFFLIRHVFWLRDYRDHQERLIDILTHYENNDWADARKTDVEWALDRRWNQEWIWVRDGLSDKLHIAYLEAGAPPLKDLSDIKAYYYWLRHKDELLLKEGTPMEEVNVLW